MTFNEVVVSYNLPFSHLLKFNSNHDDKGRFSSGGSGGGNSKLSATGANKFKAGFSSKNLNIHWDKHKSEYPGLTKEQYSKKALNLIQKPVGKNTLGYLTKQDRIVRYDKSTGDFVSGHPDIGVATMMNLKANGGIKRFNYLKNRDEKK